MLVAEELYKGYYEGFTCVDGSLPVASPRQIFQCKVCLLLINADYPALAKMTGFTHSGGYCCHWCMLFETKDMAINRIDTGGFRRWLPARSTQRAAGGNFAEVERRFPPPLREHRESVMQGVLASHHSGRVKDHPVNSTGIWEWCPLSVVPNYDLINDSPGDVMLAVMYYPHHVTKAMKGETALARPTYLKVKAKPANEAEEQDCQARLMENNRRQQDNEKAREVLSLSLSLSLESLRALSFSFSLSLSLVIMCA